jgi:hypothetical protein
LKCPDRLSSVATDTDRIKPIETVVAASLSPGDLLLVRPRVIKVS